jgi:hypothetical protein
LEKIQKIRDLAKDEGYDYLAEWCYLGKGMEEEAFSAFMSQRKELSEQSEQQIEEYRQVFQESGLQGVHRLALGKREDEISGLSKPYYDLAGTYALAGENDLAFESLNKAYELPVPFCFATEARFDSLRDDPRYEGLLRKLKLPEDAIARHMTVR